MQKYIQEMVLSIVWDWLRALPGQILDTIGWSGVIAVLAGTIMLLTLSAKAVSFMTSKRGMAITAGVLALALFVLWYWGKPDAKVPVMAAKTEPPVVKQPEVLAAKESMPTKAFDLFGGEELDEFEEEEAPAEPKRRSNLVEPPPLLVGSPIVPPSVSFSLPPTPQVPSPVVRPGVPLPHAGHASHGTAHHSKVVSATPSAHAHTGKATASSVAPGAATGGAAGHGPGASTPAADARPSRQAQLAARRQAIREHNARAADEFDRAMGQMMHEQHLIHSGQHPAMGMHGGNHMGGHPAGHHGGHHGATHPGMMHGGIMHPGMPHAGGMMHPGGHH
jgi:hypothetical protein